MGQAHFKYLRPEDLSRLANYEFAPRAVVEGYLAGRHRSHRPGLSTEFRDYRQYVPGDDPKLIDWRVYARTDRYQLRTFDQETNTTCHVFLDSSASMGFGARVRKLDYASFFAAALCYLVLRRRNVVSLLLFDEQIREYLPPGSTRLHLHHLLHALERNEPGRQTRLSTALERAFPLVRPRGTLVVISDFFDDLGAIFGALNRYLHQGFRVHLCQVLAPEELSLDDRGLVTFVDMETGQRTVAHTRALQRPYREALQAHLAGLRQLAVRRQVEYALARTDTPFFTLFDSLVKEGRHS